MDDEQLIAAALLNSVACFAAAVHVRNKRRKKRRVWVKPWFQRRGLAGKSGISWLPKAGEAEAEREFLGFLTSAQFEMLLERVRPSITRKDTKMRLAVSARERLSVTLRYLTTGETFGAVGLQYRIACATVSQIVLETCEALYRVLKAELVETPTTAAEWRSVAEEFQLRWQFPHCVGALGGKLLHCSAKAQSSMLMMAIADAKYKFLYVNVSSEETDLDAGVFWKSEVKAALDGGRLNLPLPGPLPNTGTEAPYVFVGDTAYPLRTDLMTPYPSREIEHHEGIFNYRLYRAHRVVENAFGILATRWRIFQTSVSLQPSKLAKIALAAVCLHNFLCEQRSEAYINRDLVDREEGAEHCLVEGTWRADGLGVFRPVPRKEEAKNSTAKAVQQRDALTEYFNSPAGMLPWHEPT